MNYIINFILMLGIIYATASSLIPIRSTLSHIYDLNPSLISESSLTISPIMIFAIILYTLKFIIWSILIVNSPWMILIGILLYASAFTIAWIYHEKDNVPVKLFKAGRLSFIYDIVLSTLLLLGINLP